MRHYAPTPVIVMVMVVDYFRSGVRKRLRCLLEAAAAEGIAFINY